MWPQKNSGELKPWIPSDMFHSSSRTADKFAEEFDRHGDSYTEFATAESLRKAFDNVQSKVRRDFLAILVQNKAKYFIMLARRALSKMKKIWLYRRKAKDRQIVVETFGKDRSIREKHERSRVPNISYHAA